MKTFVTIAALAAFAMLGTANAASTTLPANEAEICRSLELANASICMDYGTKPTADLDIEATGSIEPAQADYIPYLNGMGDPAGLTLSNPR